jgi:hypothetical protein
MRVVLHVVATVMGHGAVSLSKKDALLLLFDAGGSIAQ